VRTGGADVLEGTKLAARTGARYVMSPFDMLVGGAQALGGEFDRLGLTTPAQPLLDVDQKTPIDTSKPPSEQMISDIEKGGHVAGPISVPGAPIAMAPDAGAAMRFVDQYGTLAAPTGWARIAESPTFWSKVGTYGRQVGGSAVDTYLGQKAAEESQAEGGSPFAQFVAQLAAGGARTAATRAAGETARTSYGGETGGETFDASKRLGFLPTAGMVGGNELKSVEKNIGAVPIAGRGIENARARNRQAIERGLDEATGEIAQPGGGPLGGPANPDEIGQPVITAAQAKQNQLITANKAREDSLERNIGPFTDTEVSPVVDEMNRIMTSRGVGPNIGRTVAPRAADVQEAIQRQNPDDPTATTASYGAVKDIRGDLGKRTQSADPVVGGNYDRLYGTTTSAMHDAAASKGQAQEFADANEAYRKMEQEQIPFLQQFSGERNETRGGGVTFRDTPQAGTVAKKMQTATTVDPETLRGMRANLGDDVTSSAVANTVRNYGVTKEGFKPEGFSDAYAKLNEPTQQVIWGRSPPAAQKLADVNTVGNQFELRPERPGLTKSIASQLLIDRILRGGGATRLGGVAALAGGLESPDMVRALAGRADIPAILSQYALRQALINQQRQRDTNQ
jgi:hypothetical protein